MGQRPNEHRLSPKAYLRTSHLLSVPGLAPRVPPLSASSSFLPGFTTVISGACWVLQAAQQGVPSSLLCSSAWIISQKISFILWLSSLQASYRSQRLCSCLVAFIAWRYCLVIENDAGDNHPENAHVRERKGGLGLSEHSIFFISVNHRSSPEGRSCYPCKAVEEIKAQGFIICPRSHG